MYIYTHIYTDKSTQYYTWRSQFFFDHTVLH